MASGSQDREVVCSGFVQKDQNSFEALLPGGWMGGLKAGMILSSCIVDADSTYDRIMPTLQTELDKHINKKIKKKSWQRFEGPPKLAFKVDLKYVPSSEQFEVGSVNYKHIPLPYKSSLWRMRARYAERKNRNCSNTSLTYLKTYASHIAKQLGSRKCLKGHYKECRDSELKRLLAMVGSRRDFLGHDQESSLWDRLHVDLAASRGDAVLSALEKNIESSICEQIKKVGRSSYQS